MHPVSPPSLAPVADPDAAGLRARIEGLVVKEGVSLGGLPAAERELALALVGAALPPGPSSERDINAALRAALDGAAGWLATDAVELRRWLVDAGWLRRDRFGHEYRRGDPTSLLPSRQALAAALVGVDVEALATGARRAHAARRQARHQAWLAAQQPPVAEPASGPGARARSRRGVGSSAAGPCVGPERR
jgi:hypothetical protein